VWAGGWPGYTVRRAIIERGKASGKQAHHWGHGADLLRAVVAGHVTLWMMDMIALWPAHPPPLPEGVGYGINNNPPQITVQFFDLDYSQVS